jgi:hypothetical protein
VWAATARPHTRRDGDRRTHAHLADRADRRQAGPWPSRRKLRGGSVRASGISLTGLFGGPCHRRRSRRDPVPQPQPFRRLQRLAALSAWPVVLVARATGDHSRSCCAAGSRRHPYGGQPGTRLPEVQLLTRRHSRQPSPRRPSDRCPAVALFPPLVTASNTASLLPAAGRCTAHGEDQARPAPPALAEGPARWHATPAPAQR